MSLVINTNVSSLDAQRNLATNADALAVSVQRLSSGLRINSAKDDAAGLAISSKLSAQVRSIAVAIRNSQDGTSLAQTAEGGLQQIGDILARMRELSTQSANGTLATSDREATDAEFQQLKKEIDRISNVTEFNGIKLLDGSLSANGIILQVGFRNDKSATKNDQITIKSGAADAKALKLGTGIAQVTLTDGTIEKAGTGSTAAGFNGNIASAANARTMLDNLDTAIGMVSTMRGNLGAIQNRLTTTISNLSISSENLSAAGSRIRDADFAAETATFTRNQILVQSATAILAQANSLPQQALQLLK